MTAMLRRLPIARALIVVTALAVALPACGFGLARRGASPSPTKPVDYGSNVTIPTTQKPGKNTSKVELYLVDAEDGTGVPGAFIEYTGADTGRMVTDERGRGVAHLKPGTYKLSVPHCGRDVLVNDTAEADLRVAGGAPVRQELGRVAWEWRYQPTESALAEPRAPWKRNEVVDAQVKLQDGCTFKAAPNRTLVTHAWRVSDHYRIVETPTMRSDGEGYLHVTVACRARGDGEIAIYDRADTSDAVNVITAISAPSDGGPFCRA